MSVCGIKEREERLKDGGVLQDEGQNGRAERGIVPKLLQVTAVFPLRPHRHLDEAHQREEGHGQTLGHQGEAQPRAQLHTHTHHNRAVTIYRNTKMHQFVLCVVHPK